MHIYNQRRNGGEYLPVWAQPSADHTNQSTTIFITAITGRRSCPAGLFASGAHSTYSYSLCVAIPFNAQLHLTTAKTARRQKQINKSCKINWERHIKSIQLMLSRGKNQKHRSDHHQSIISIDKPVIRQDNTLLDNRRPVVSQFLRIHTQIS